MTDKGASRSQRACGACVAGNRNLLLDILLKFESKPERIRFLNTAKNSLGEYCLHLAAKHGHADILDFLTSRYGLEIDYVDAIQHETALHKAIRFINNLKPEEWETEGGNPLVVPLTDAGADLKIRNKAGQRPIDLVDPRNKELRLYLLKEEFGRAEGDGVVNTEMEEEEKEKDRYDRDRDSLLSIKFDDDYEQEPPSDGE